MRPCVVVDGMGCCAIDSIARNADMYAPRKGTTHRSTRSQACVPRAVWCRCASASSDRPRLEGWRQRVQQKHSEIEENREKAVDSCLASF